MHAVQPVQRPKQHLLPPLKLYREDLEKIVEIFNKHCQSIVIDDGEYSYTSVDEIKQKKTNLELFHVAGFISHGELWIKGAEDPSVQRSMIWVVESSDKGNLLFLSLKDFLLTKRWSLKIWLVRILFGVSGFLFLATLLFKFWLTSKLPHGDFWYGVVVVCMLIVFVTAVYLDIKKLSSISLQSNSAKEPFLRRNTDSIVMLVVGTVLGALTTLLIEWFKFHFLR